jgi:rhodanese-related sulfurtransferase
MLYQTISPKELFERLKNNGERVNLIDVREPYEFETARIDGAKLLPLSCFREWIETLGAETEIVVMCHHGVRSARVCEYLAQNNFTKVFNLDGGIDSWSLEVDTDVPRY